MAHADDLELVVRLACLTEDRARDEQRALLRLAVKVEAEYNASTTRNMKARWDLPPCTLVDEVECSHRPGDSDPILLSAKDRERVDRRRVSFVRERQEAIDRHGEGWRP